MAKQINDDQYYAVKACIERAYQEIENAWKCMFGNTKPAQIGAEQLQENTLEKKVFAPKPPRVTKDHQDAVDGLDPEVQSQVAAKEEVDSADLKGAISNEVQVISASASGTGDFYALVKCPNTHQEASIEIHEDEYEQLQDVVADDDVMMEISEDQIDSAEWELTRGTSTDTMAVCNCGGNVPNANPYNDEKVEAEIASGHLKMCSWWSYNTVIYDKQTGAGQAIALENIGVDESNGFELYKKDRKEMLKIAADKTSDIVYNKDKKIFSLSKFADTMDLTDPDEDDV